MKTIQHFKASGVFGYLTMDLSLNDDLTFLYGLNGSGKTTALKLIMALLEPSLEPLIRIPFTQLSLRGDTHRAGSVEIVAQKHDTTLEIRSSLAPEAELSLEINDLDMEDISEIQARHLKPNPVMQALEGIVSPIFLGIDRRFKAPQPLHRRRRLPTQRQMAYEFERERGFADPSFDAGLGEVAAVIEDFMRQLRLKQAKIDNQFRKQILLDAFSYVDPQTHGFTEPTEKMIRTFRGKRRAITETLKSLELASEEFEARSEHFFTTIETVINDIRKLSAKEKKKTSKAFLNAMTAWFVNQPQVDRIDRLFEAANKYQTEQESVYKPLTAFVELTNKFFIQTGKEVRIDRAGDVQIKMGKRSTSLNALSSGERQIFIMLAHLSMNRRLLKDGVFIVDEPELSLHMDWQNMFVDAVQTANPKLQLILATHAPAIIGGRNDLCVPVSTVEGD